LPALRLWRVWRLPVAPKQAAAQPLRELWTVLRVLETVPRARLRELETVQRARLRELETVQRARLRAQA
jgi:hypothetical protein